MALSKDKRIRKRRDFLRVQRNGLRSFGRFVVVIAQKDKEGSSGKIGITVPKKVGIAHIRNKVKRRLRHVMRLNQTLFFEKNLVIVARDCASAVTFKELELDLIEACRRLRQNKFWHERIKHWTKKVA